MEMNSPSTEEIEQDAIEEKIMAREMAPTTEEEIEYKLSELNLTVEPRLKNKRRSWFYDRKIILHTLYGRIYREISGIDWDETVSHLLALNEGNQKLLIVKAENDIAGRKFTLEKGMYCYAQDQSLCDTANEIATDMRIHLIWFRERNLRLQLIKTIEYSYYVYQGLKTADNSKNERMVIQA